MNKKNSRYKVVEEFIWSFIFAPFIGLPYVTYLLIKLLFFSDVVWSIKLIMAFSCILGMVGFVYAPIDYFRKRKNK